MFHEPPMFVFNAETYKNNLVSLQNAFKKRMGAFKVGYSFKTNPHPIVLKEALNIGCLAEVVSPYEYQEAIEAGFPKERIIYNGVCKDIEQAASMCRYNIGYVNADSIEEIVEIDKYSNHDFWVGARLTFDAGNDCVSRFGIPIRSRDFQRLLEIERHSDHIHIVGLSCHITHARSAEEWKLRAETMASVARKFKHLKYIDLGGNMYSPMDDEYGSNFPERVTFEEYADAVCPAFKELDVELIVEAGTPLIANAVDIDCEILAIKENCGRTFIVVNASSCDIGPSCRCTKLPYTIKNDASEHSRRKVEHASVVGYTCIEDDVIHSDFSGSISVGDRIVFRNVGAYSVSFASNFIMPSPEVVLGKD